MNKNKTFFFKWQEMEDKLETKSGFDSEFQSLRMLEDRLVLSADEGMKPVNSTKNRYRNILPCE